jgi:hypothetical protein
MWGIIIGMMKTKSKPEPEQKIAVLFSPKETKFFFSGKWALTLHSDGRVEFPVRPANATIARKVHWQAARLKDQLGGVFFGALKRKNAWWAPKALASLSRGGGGAWWETGEPHIWVFTSGGAIKVKVKTAALEKRAFWLAKYGKELFEGAIRKEVI